MIVRDPTATETWPLSLPPTRGQMRWAVGVAVGQVAALAIVAPFAKLSLRRSTLSLPRSEGSDPRPT